MITLKAALLANGKVSELVRKAVAAYNRPDDAPVRCVNCKLPMRQIGIDWPAPNGVVFVGTPGHRCEVCGEEVVDLVASEALTALARDLRANARVSVPDLLAAGENIQGVLDAANEAASAR